LCLARTGGAVNEDIDPLLSGFNTSCEIWDQDVSFRFYLRVVWEPQTRLWSYPYRIFQKFFCRSLSILKGQVDIITPQSQAPAEAATVGSAKHFKDTQEAGLK